MAELPLIKPARDLLSNTSTTTDLRPAIAASRRQGEALNFALDRVTQAVFSVGQKQNKSKKAANELLARDVSNQLKMKLYIEFKDIGTQIENDEITDISQLSTIFKSFTGYSSAISQYSQEQALAMDEYINEQSNDLVDLLYSRQKKLKGKQIVSKFNEGIDALDTFFERTLNNSALNLDDKLNKIQAFENELSNAIDTSLGDNIDSKNNLNARVKTIKKVEFDEYVTKTLLSEKYLRANGIKRHQIYQKVLSDDIGELGKLIENKTAFAENIRQRVLGIIQFENEFAAEKKNSFISEITKRKNQIEGKFRRMKKDGLTAAEVTELNNEKELLLIDINLTGVDYEFSTDIRNFLDNEYVPENSRVWMNRQKNLITRGGLSEKDIETMSLKNEINSNEFDELITTYNNTVGDYQDQIAIIKSEFGVLEGIIGERVFKKIYESQLPNAINAFVKKMKALEATGQAVNPNEIRRQIVSQYKDSKTHQELMTYVNQIADEIDGIWNDPENYDLSTEDINRLKKYSMNIRESKEIIEEELTQIFLDTNNKIQPKFESKWISISGKLKYYKNLLDVIEENSVVKDEQ